MPRLSLSAPNCLTSFAFYRHFYWVYWHFILFVSSSCFPNASGVKKHNTGSPAAKPFAGVNQPMLNIFTRRRMSYLFKCNWLWKSQYCVCDLKCVLLCRWDEAIINSKGLNKNEGVCIYLIFCVLPSHSNTFCPLHIVRIVTLKETYHAKCRLFFVWFLPLLQCCLLSKNNMTHFGHLILLVSHIFTLLQQSCMINLL